MKHSTLLSRRTGRTLASLALVVVAATSLVGAAADSSDSERAAVRAVGQQWKALYEQGRYAEIPELYTEDTMVMPRNRPRIEGREQMRRAVGGLAAGRKVDIEMQEREITVDGDFAWFIGDFRVTYTPKEPGAAPKTEFGRSLIIFRKDADGRWRVHRDIDSPAPHPVAGAR